MWRQQRRQRYAVRDSDERPADVDADCARRVHSLGYPFADRNRDEHPYPDDRRAFRDTDPDGLTDAAVDCNTDGESDVHPDSNADAR